MLRVLTTIVAMLMGAVVTLASVLLLLEATWRIELMESEMLRGAAILGTFVAGVVVLIGSVYLYTRLAVLLFGGQNRSGG